MIQRFSEDLDSMVERGTVTGLPEVTSWTSTNKGPVAKRRACHDALAAALAGRLRVGYDPVQSSTASTLSLAQRR